MDNAVIASLIIILRNKAEILFAPSLKLSYFWLNYSFQAQKHLLCAYFSCWMAYFTANSFYEIV